MRELRSTPAWAPLVDAALPEFGVGHSNGALLHLLSGALGLQRHAGDALISFNNKCATLLPCSCNLRAQRQQLLGACQLHTHIHVRALLLKCRHAGRARLYLVASRQYVTPGFHVQRLMAHCREVTAAIPVPLGSLQPLLQAARQMPAVRSATSEQVGMRLLIAEDSPWLAREAPAALASRYVAPVDSAHYLCKTDACAAPSSCPRPRHTAPRGCCSRTCPTPTRCVTPAVRRLWRRWQRWRRRGCWTQRRPWRRSWTSWTSFYAR